MPITLTNRLTNRQHVFTLPAGATYNFANNQPGDYIFNNDSPTQCFVQLNRVTFSVAAGTKWEFIVHPELVADGSNPISAGLTGMQLFPVGPQAAGPPPLPFNPSVDLNFGANQYYGVLGAPSNFLSVVDGPGSAVDSNGNWQQFGVNVPRIMSGTGLWVEESRQNILLQTAALVSGWQSGGSNNTPGQASPDGLTDASLIADTTANAEHFIFSNGTAFTPAAAGTIYTVSMLCKLGTAGFAGLSLASGGLVDGFFATVNLTTGAIAQSGHYGTGTLTTASAILYPNGWIRLQVTGSIGTVEAAFAIISNVPDGATAPNISYTGTGTGYFVFWPQLELGGFATTPIPTTTVAITRAATVIKLVAPPTFGAMASLVGMGAPEAPVVSTSGNQIMGEIDDGTTNNRLAIFRAAADGTARYTYTIGGTTNVAAGAVWAQNTAGKLAAAGATGLQNGSFNGGVLFTTSGVGALAGLNQMLIGSGAGGIQFWDGSISRMTYYPTALTGPQLQQIST